MKTSALLAALLAALSLSACGGGSGSSSSAVCDEYEKAFAEATKDVDAATKDMMQKSFEQTKEYKAARTLAPFRKIFDT